MGDSNGSWADLAEHDAEMAAAWDGYERLPDQGENLTLDAFCDRKNIEIPELVKQGARLLDDTVIAYAYAGGPGIKYRNLDNGKRWDWPGSTFPQLKIVPHSDKPTERVIVSESETDAAWLSQAYDIDVAILPSGAKAWLDKYAEQLSDYAQVLLGHDNDEAGAIGIAKAKAALPQAVRFAPPAADWCEVDGTLPKLPPLAKPLDLIVMGKELMELVPPEIYSWFDHGILPVGGQLMIHGFKGSFKSWTGFDMCSALAQGVAWGGFDNCEEPAKVCVLQYEIPWFFYQERMALIRSTAEHPDLWDKNFGTWQPTLRPDLVAGNVKLEDRYLTAFAEHGIQVVLVDPIRRATGAIDFNAEQDARKILHFFQRMQDNGITVISTHHDNKDSTKHHEADLTSPTGSGAFVGDADTIVSSVLPYGGKVTDLQRNLGFYVRNGPPVSMRGMEISDEGILSYRHEPFNSAPGADDGSDDGPDV